MYERWQSFRWNVRKLGARDWFLCAIINAGLTIREKYRRVRAKRPV